MAIEKVRERLLRATAVLEDARILYAVSGGNAVAEWVGRVDQAAVRFTQDVDILIRREDLPATTEAMKAAGFIYQFSFGVAMFLDGPDSRPRDAVHLLFANEKVRDSDCAPAPDASESEITGDFRVVSLAGLVRMKLTAFRDKDRTHLRDLLDVGLIDESWCPRLPAELAGRLQSLIDDPDG